MSDSFNKIEQEKEDDPLPLISVVEKEGASSSSSTTTAINKEEGKEGEEDPPSLTALDEDSTATALSSAPSFFDKVANKRQPAQQRQPLGAQAGNIKAG